MSMKKKAIILWCVFSVCLIATVVLWFAVNAQKIEYEEVEVRVLSAELERHNGGVWGSSTRNKVMVDYKGETYKLENSHNLYPQGGIIKAYLANNGRLFANIEGIKTSTLIAKVYFAFLYISFGLLMVSAAYSGHIWEKSKKNI